MMRFIGFFCVLWLVMSVSTTAATNKPFAQCFTSLRFDCE